MKRRTFLGGTGTTAAAAVAGCFSINTDPHPATLSIAVQDTDAEASTTTDGEAVEPTIYVEGELTWEDLDSQEYDVEIGVVSVPEFETTSEEIVRDEFSVDGSEEGEGSYDFELEANLTDVDGVESDDFMPDEAGEVEETEVEFFVDATMDPEDADRATSVSDRSDRFTATYTVEWEDDSRGRGGGGVGGGGRGGDGPTHTDASADATVSEWEPGFE